MGALRAQHETGKSLAGTGKCHKVCACCPADCYYYCCVLFSAAVLLRAFIHFIAIVQHHLTASNPRVKRFTALLLGFSAVTVRQSDTLLQLTAQKTPPSKLSSLRLPPGISGLAVARGWVRAVVCTMTSSRGRGMSQVSRRITYVPGYPIFAGTRTRLLRVTVHSGISVHIRAFVCRRLFID